MWICGKIFWDPGIWLSFTAMEYFNRPDLHFKWLFSALDWMLMIPITFFVYLWIQLQTLTCHGTPLQLLYVIECFFKDLITLPQVNFSRQFANWRLEAHPLMTSQKKLIKLRDIHIEKDNNWSRETSRTVFVHFCLWTQLWRHLWMSPWWAQMESFVELMSDHKFLKLRILL